MKLRKILILFTFLQIADVSSSASVNLPADFLNLLLMQRGQQPVDPCYDELDKSKYCRPDFVNAALGRQVQSSSECGQSSRGPETICRLSNMNGIGREPEINRSCYLCDARHEATKHSANLVTDINDPRNATCWISSLLPYNSDTNATSSGSNVTLTLSLGKRFEITYVSVTFCQEEPTAFSIWKSNDHGVTWQPFRMYAQNCRQAFGTEPGEAMTKRVINNKEIPFISGRHTRRDVDSDEGAGDDDDDNDDDDDDDLESKTPGLSPTCIEHYGSSSPVVHPGVSLSQSRIVFPTLELAPPSVSLDDLDTSPELQKWVTATDLRIEFSRLPAHYSAASIAEARYYSVADLAVGGRCACNGHASKCIETPGSSGRLQCDCRHNTQGEDCGKCKPFFVDRPWRRATREEPNECIACNCNLHARQCRFNKELWELSGRKSGGVCVGCRHNTAGRNCQYCREGFFRDHTKPITHRRACKVCHCHPVGSLGKTCNQTTGQCPCKEGVEGISCSRCAPGYQQTNSPIQPCVRVSTIAPPVVTEVSYYQADDPYVESTMHAIVRNVKPQPRSYAPRHHQQRGVTEHRGDDNSCDSVCAKGKSGRAGPRLSFRRWCQSHLAALIQVEKGAKLRVGSWTRLNARLYRVFSRRGDEYNDDGEGDDDDYDDGIDDDIDDDPLMLPSGDEISLWIPTRALDCKCIRLRSGRKWLVTGRMGRVMAPAPSKGGRAGRSATPVAQFMLDPKSSAVVRWRPSLETRIRKFTRMNRAGVCRKHNQKSVTPVSVPIEVVETPDIYASGQDGGEPVVDARQQYGAANTASPQPVVDYMPYNAQNIQVVPSISRRSSSAYETANTYGTSYHQPRPRNHLRRNAGKRRRYRRYESERNH